MPEPLTLTITPTDVLTVLDGVPCRKWDGVTAGGVRCAVFVHRVAVHRVAVHRDEDPAAFARALVEQLPPAVPAPLDVALGGYRAG